MIQLYSALPDGGVKLVRVGEQGRSSCSLKKRGSKNKDLTVFLWPNPREKKRLIWMHIKKPR